LYIFVVIQVVRGLLSNALHASFAESVNELADATHPTPLVQYAFVVIAVSAVKNGFGFSPAGTKVEDANVPNTPRVPLALSVVITQGLPGVDDNSVIAAVVGVVPSAAMLASAAVSLGPSAASMMSWTNAARWASSVTSLSRSCAIVAKSASV
jgi:hypothetical protein